MILKLIGIILVLFASYTIGKSLSNEIITRLNDIRKVKLCLQILEKEISFLNNSLPVALQKAGETRSNVGKIFNECGVILNSRQGLCADEAWNMSIEKFFKHTSLNDEDKGIMSGLSKLLGSYDTENQINNIKIVYDQFCVQEKKAEELVNRDVKLYKKLSVLGGLAIVVLLV